MSIPPAIIVSSLSKHFGEVRAVDGLSFEVYAGEIFGLVGPDGAGKTTTLRMLAGVMAADSGSAQVAGCDVVRDPEGAKSLLSYMSQRFGLYEDLTVDENLRFYADLFGVRSQAARAALPGIAGGRGPERFPQPPGGKSFRRDEAKARLGLCADSYSEGDPPRRADQRSRSGVAAGFLAHSLFAGGRGRGDSHFHVVPRRSGALPSRGAPPSAGGCFSAIGRRN